MMTVISTLVRFAIWMARREAERDSTHGRPFEDVCMCDACGWVRGLEAEADEKLGRAWR